MVHAINDHPSENRDEGAIDYSNDSNACRNWTVAVPDRLVPDCLGPDRLGPDRLGDGHPAAAQSTDPRDSRGLKVITTLSGGAGQPVLDALRRDMPALGDAVLKYALGDVFGSEALDIRTRQLAVVAAFAAQGNLPYLKVHAGYALNNGVKPQELLDIALVTTVTAGFPRAIDAAQALREVFTQRGIALPLTKN